MCLAGMLAVFSTTEAGVCPFGHDTDANMVFGDHDIESVSGYNSQTAQEKFDYLRHKIDSTPESAPWCVREQQPYVYTFKLSLSHHTL